jgi:hypothetical protein
MIYTVYKTLRYAVTPKGTFSVDAICNNFVFTKNNTTSFRGTKDECDKLYDSFVPVNLR